MNREEKLQESIILFDSGISLTNIGKKLHISRDLVSKHIKETGRKVKISKLNKELYLEAKIDYIKNNLSITKIAKKYKICPSNFSKYLKENGIDVINRQNLLRFNENIFDNIDTEEKAYWLGFIYADGYIDSSPLEESKKSVYNFELSLALHDKDHLQKFADFMEHPTNIKCDSYRCRFLIANKHLWNILNNYGCTPRKSLTLEFPDENIFKSKDLIRHFIRGYVDGDGCLSYKDKDHKDPIISILGTKNFLLKFSKYFNAERSLHNKVNKNTYTYSIVSAKAIMLSFLLYNNSIIYLDRKYNKFLEFMDCRLNMKIFKLLEGCIGEGWKANTERFLNRDFSIQKFCRA